MTSPVILLDKLLASRFAWVGALHRNNYEDSQATGAMNRAGDIHLSLELFCMHTEEFEAEVNVPCPIHGPCRLGVLIIISVQGSDPGKARREQLIQEYYRRCHLWKEGARNEGSL